MHSRRNFTCASSTGMNGSCSREDYSSFTKPHFPPFSFVQRSALMHVAKTEFSHTENTLSGTTVIYNSTVHMQMKSEFAKTQ